MATIITEEDLELIEEKSDPPEPQALDLQPAVNQPHAPNELAIDAARDAAKKKALTKLVCIKLISSTMDHWKLGYC